MTSGEWRVANGGEQPFSGGTFSILHSPFEIPNSELSVWIHLELPDDRFKRGVVSRIPTGEDGYNTRNFGDSGHGAAR